MTKESAVEAVTAFLNAEGWQYSYFREPEIITMTMGLDCSLGHVFMIVDFDEDSYTVYAVSPIFVDPEDSLAILIFLSAVNYGLKEGNFEIDLTDGEMRYKFHVSFDHVTDLPAEMIEKSLVIPPCMFEMYGDGIAAAAEGCEAYSD